MRKLHIFTPPRSEVLISNNSGLHFSLAALRKHGRDIHPDLRLIVPPFWLDNVLPEYNDLDWGQPAYCLPWFVREEFSRIYPTYPKDKKITWGQYKDLRTHTIEELKKTGVNVLYGIPEILKESDRYKLVVNNETFYVPQNTHFYNSFREIRTEHKFNDIPKVSHTVLYKTPRDKVPKTAIILGGGRSAIWIANHFPETLFACITPNNKLPLFTDEKAPDNLILFCKDGLATDDNGYKLIPNLDDNKHKAIIVETNKKGGKSNPLFSGHFYAAIGLRQRLDITNMIASKSLTVYPGEKEWDDDWIAPENVPPGSLMEATARWSVATHNMSWACETFCYHSNQFISIIMPKLQENGLVLPYSFFDYLRSEIISRQSVTTLDETIEIYKLSFKNAYGEDLPRGSLELLEKTLRKIEEDRIEYHNTFSSFRP